ncbi:MAG: endolytic transglycosylase MltG [Clostridiales bacterium]|jgi:UPF0755 protein|nr:endolytic transglycosylase MltG [Clostridiales bacterium]
MWRRVINVSNYLFGGLFNIGLALGLIAVAVFVTNWAFDQGMTVFSTDDIAREPVQVIVEIPEDAGPADVARILEEHELISSAFLFRLESMFNGSANHFLHGTFELNTGMSSSDLMFALNSPEFLAQEEEGRVVLIEGLTNRQIADVAATLGYFSAAEFLYSVENEFFAHSFLAEIAERPNRLEGFLFPDTYNLPANPSPRDLIVRQLDRFADIYDQHMAGRVADLYGILGWQPTLEQVVIVASIIEVEAVIAAERPIVAAVIYNRLAANMPLEMITTVVYATNRRADLLTTADFQINSPYNTFGRTGLPVGAISNPGLSALEAALSPANVNYLFMLKLADEPVGHLFFETAGEFNEARAAIGGE